MTKYAMTVVVMLLVASAVVVLTRTGQTPVASSSFGPMALYESAEHPFSIEYPAEWTDYLKVQNSSVVVWRMSSQGEWFIVVENTSTEGESVLSEYVDRVISWDSRTDPQHEMVSREQTKTEQGLPAELLEYTISQGGEPVTVNALIYLHDNKIVGTRMAYGVPTARYEDMKGMIEYSFSTFHVAN